MAEAPTAPGVVRHMEGKAYAVADGHLMYRESHWLYDDVRPSQDTTVSRADLLAAEQAPLDGQCHIP